MEYQFCPRCGGGLAARSLKSGEPGPAVCGGCEFVFYLDPKVAAAVIVPYEGKIILLQRGIEPRLGSWSFPAARRPRRAPRARGGPRGVGRGRHRGHARGLLGVYTSRPAAPSSSSSTAASGFPASRRRAMNSPPWVSTRPPKCRARPSAFRYARRAPGLLWRRFGSETG